MQKNSSIRKVLIAPLDWGLGHATRCIPLINELQRNGCEVMIAATGIQKYLLQNEFPELIFISLNGYNIRYTKEKRWLALKILLQLPKIFFSIRREHKWLEETIIKTGIDIVISDNRFGLWTKKIPCIFLTHQLQINAPFNRVKNFLQKINYGYINHYTECWVPDFEGRQNIAGSLSHPKKMPSLPVRYTGPLSRFEKRAVSEKKYEWLVILSGPEPQRTLLEKKVIGIAPQLKGKLLIVRGMPGNKEKIDAPENCFIVNHLATIEMEQAFAESEYIVSRSGYTTVMEILAMQKKSILVPTPGQTEQEYLAGHLMQQGWCYSFKQGDDFLFHLNSAMNFDFTFPSLGLSTLPIVVNDFLSGLK